MMEERFYVLPVVTGEEYKIANLINENKKGLSHHEYRAISFSKMISQNRSDGRNWYRAEQHALLPGYIIIGVTVSKEDGSSMPVDVIDELRLIPGIRLTTFFHQFMEYPLPEDEVRRLFQVSYTDELHIELSEATEEQEQTANRLTELIAMCKRVLKKRGRTMKAYLAVEFPWFCDLCKKYNPILLQETRPVSFLLDMFGILLRKGLLLTS